MTQGHVPSAVATFETMADRSPTWLSIVIATIKPWPEIRRCLDSLHSQAQAVEAEVLVADGHGGGLPDDVGDRYPEVIWIKHPGESVFVLRGIAMAQARGVIVAVTEDHCEVTSDWCERLIKVHQEHPDAAAIGGVVENGATERLIDWANFLVIFGPFTAPIENGEHEHISLQANISYKRRVLPRVAPQFGMMEMLFNKQLRQQGEKLVADDRLVVYHIQSWGFLGTFAAHFHNGRSIAGFRLQRMAWGERILRLAGCFILPPVLLWRTVGPVVRKRRLRRQALISLHLTVLVVTCHAVGEFVGYLVGPGESPTKLR